jgi:tetraacyldisaccharide 4'-kinase
MSARALLERLWRRERALADAPLWLMLTPLSAAYRGVLTLRSAWWRAMARCPPLATISVGNLTVGGNGKTPLTLFLANRLSTQGYRVGIVGRGYGAANRQRSAMVADGGAIFLDVDQAGDEPLLMAHRFAGPIAVARRRLDGIALLAARGPLDAIILDDAFQHIRLRRDLDIVAINARRGFGNGWLLPAGPLREPPSAIRRAGVIVLVADDDLSPGSCAVPLEFTDTPMVRATLRPTALIRVDGAGWSPTPIALSDSRVLAVSGLADPRGFTAMLNSLGARIAERLEYPDHHRYTPADWDSIGDAARAADLVVTTEKDLVKLERCAPRLLSLRALRLDVVMDSADEARLLAMAAACIERRRGGATSSADRFSAATPPV